MNVSSYVRKKMSFRELFILWTLHRRANRSLVKMDYYIKRGNHKIACKYEDLAYKSDDAFVDFIVEMNTKYA